jgi:hypothetical protein
MRRLLTTLALTSLLLLATAAVALADSDVGHDGGEGWLGETDDRVVTNAGFILIAAFPLVIFLASMIQSTLDRRKDARKKAAKARAARADVRGGW